MLSSASDDVFSTEQKEYLAGLAAGLATRGLFPFAGHTTDGRITCREDESSANLAAPVAEENQTFFGVPIDELSKEERFKWEENPLDIWDKILAHAADDRAPEGGDIFRFKFHGLFYVAPTQDSFMLRVRIPGSTLTSTQMRGLARIARDWGGGYADVTTRSNIQIREFAPRNIVDVLMTLSDLGLTSRGAGADNVRNVTATPTSGLDPTEVFDVQPIARGFQFYLNNNRDLFGLPRKFNIAFNSGGAVSVVSDTNDIGFVATRSLPDSRRGARRLLPGSSRRHHRPQTLRHGLRHPGEAGGVRRSGGGDGPRVQRTGRSDRPEESAAVLRPRSDRHLRIPGQGTAEACVPAALRRPGGVRARHARWSGTDTSASIRRSSRICTTSAWRCRSAG